MTTTIINPIGGQHHTLAMELMGTSREIRCVSSLRELDDGLGEKTRLALFPADLLEFLAPRRRELLPNATLVAWTPRTVRRIYEIASEIEQVVAVLAWPSDKQSPRAWEVQSLARHVLADRIVPIDPLEISSKESEVGEWWLANTDDISRYGEMLGELVVSHGAARRASTRITATAHELFMNAVYDAPVDAQGKPRYAYDRTAHVVLDESDRVRVTYACTDDELFLQVTDRFGGLRREHVYASVRRGFRSADGDARPEDFIDSSHGGAGLGMHRIMTGANATVCEVIPGVSTVVTTLFELAMGNREARRSPRSLHFHQSAPVS